MQGIIPYVDNRGVILKASAAQKPPHISQLGVRKCEKFSLRLTKLFVPT
jgi:hypothetical protein